MSRTSFTRWGAAALVATVTAAVFVAGGDAAFAAGAVPSAGSSMTVSPASGNNFVKPTLALSGPCGVGTTHYGVLLYGGSAGSQMPDDGQLMISGDTGLSTSSAFSITTSNTFQDTAADAGVANLGGSYVIEVRCLDDFENLLGRFTAPVNFSSPTTFTAPVPAVDTTTALAASPASPQQAGTSVTFTATVTKVSGTGAPSGSVEFFDGSTSIGTQATNASGVASLATSSLSVGLHSITAAFTGSGFNGSTSSAVSYSITAAPAKTTATSLTVTPAGPVDAGQSVTLACTVSVTGGSAANGSIEFYDGATKISTKPVVSGAASYATSFASAGVHTLKAVFVPSDVAVQLGSESTPQDLAVNAVATQALENITVHLVETGALTISVQDQNVFLPDFTLDAAADRLSSGGPINPVTVTDTRLYEQGWSVSGQVTDFTSSSTDTTISSTGLGWTPNVVSKPTATTVINAGSVVAPFTAGGLSTAKTLASAPADEGRGTTVLGADLLLKAPTTTKPGTYTALLTLTVA